MSVTNTGKILTRGTEAQLPNTVEDGKLRFTTDTRRLFLDNGQSRIEFTDFVKGNTEEQIQNILAPLPKVYIASDTDTLWIYSAGEWHQLAGRSTSVDHHTVYGICQTPGDQRHKVATIQTESFTSDNLTPGAIVGVKFFYTNTVDSYYNPFGYINENSFDPSVNSDDTACIDLNVNNTGAKPINFKGMGPSYTTRLGQTIWVKSDFTAYNNTKAFGTSGAYTYFMYDGTYWTYIGFSKPEPDQEVYTPAKVGCGFALDSRLAASDAITATMADFRLCTGGIIVLKLNYAIADKSSVTLNINDTGAKTIKRNSLTLQLGETVGTTKMRGAAYETDQNGQDKQIIEKNAGSTYTDGERGGEAVDVYGHAEVYGNENIAEAGDLIVLVYDGTYYNIIATDRGVAEDNGDYGELIDFSGPSMNMSVQGTGYVGGNTTYHHDPDEEQFPEVQGN